MKMFARFATLVAILASAVPAATCMAANNGVVLFGSGDPSVRFQSSLTSAASIKSVSGGSITGSPSFDSVKGMIPGADGGAYFEGAFLNTQNAGQLSLEVETTLISQPSPDQFADAIGGSAGYNHLADGWQTLLDMRSADNAEIASLGLTSTAGIGGNYRGESLVGLGVHSAGKAPFVRVTLSWSGNTSQLYVDGLLVWSGSGAALDIGKMAVGYFAPGTAGILRYHIRNLVLASRPVTLPVHPLLRKIVIYGDSFASQANPYAIGSTEFESTAGFQLLRDMDDAGMSIGQLQLKDYPGETLNKNPEPNQVSFQVGTNHFGGSASKLADVVNADPDYVIVLGGTNDAAGDAAERGAVAPTFATDLLSLCRTILNNQRTKGVVMQTIMSLKGNSAFASPAFVANVAAVDTIIRALPSVWDSTYPAERGKVKVVDTFAATGGQSAAADMEKGSLTGAQDDLHPTAFASVISGDLIAGALQSFLATTGAISVTNCVSNQNGVILQSSASLTIDLAGATPCTDYGQYDVSQLLTLDQPALDVILSNGFTPTAGQSFKILSWARLNGTFGTVTLPTLAGGLSWDTSALYTTGTIKVKEPSAPTIIVTGGGNQALVGGSSAAPVTLTVAGGGVLKVTAVSSNTALVANSAISVSANCGSMVHSCSANFSVASGQTGSSTLTLMATDAFGQSGSATATVAVRKPAPPTISITAGGNQSFTAESSALPVSFTVVGGGPLKVTVVSSNSALLPNSGISVSANCGSTVHACSARFSVAAGQTGSSMLTLTVADAYGQAASATATVDVTKPSPPKIRLTAGGNQSFPSGTSAAPVAFAVAGTGPLNVTASSSDTILLPDVSVTPNCGSTVLSCSANLEVAPGQTGTSTVTLRVADEYDQTGTATADIQVNAASSRTGGGGGVGVVSLFGLACLRATRWLSPCGSSSSLS